MRLTAMVFCLMLLLAVSASAGQNPYIRAFVTFVPNGYVHSLPDALPGTVVDAYLCFDTLGEDGHYGGMTGVSLVIDFLCSGYPANSADVTVFHPNAWTVVGGPDDTVNGWVIAAPECVYTAPTGILCVARIPWYYLGVPGDILILPGSEGKATVDCNSGIDFFCVLSHGAIGQDVLTPGDENCDSAFPTMAVYCEPQGGEFPSHPPTYWYNASPGYAEHLDGLHVRVLDPDIENYTNWVDPYGWTHADTIAMYDGAYWVTWYDTTCLTMPEFGYLWFKFDNPNLSSWGHWTMTVGCGGDDLDPYEGMTGSSWDFSDKPDGYGYRVHVPTAGSPTERTSWGAIKALYR